MCWLSSTLLGLWRNKKNYLAYFFRMIFIFLLFLSNVIMFFFFISPISELTVVRFLMVIWSSWTLNFEVALSRVNSGCNDEFNPVNSALSWLYNSANELTNDQKAACCTGAFASDLSERWVSSEMPDWLSSWAGAAWISSGRETASGPRLVGFALGSTILRPELVLALLIDLWKLLS